jgi:hypothetical protein
VVATATELLLVVAVVAIAGGQRVQAGVTASPSRPLACGQHNTRAVWRSAVRAFSKLFLHLCFIVVLVVVLINVTKKSKKIAKTAIHNISKQSDP